MSWVAAQIETIDQSKLQERRFTLYAQHRRVWTALSKNRLNQDTPETLYFCGHKNGDTNARRSLQLEGTEALNHGRDAVCPKATFTPLETM